MRLNDHLTFFFVFIFYFINFWHFAKIWFIVFKIILKTVFLIFGTFTSFIGFLLFIFSSHNFVLCSTSLRSCGRSPWILFLPRIRSWWPSKVYIRILKILFGIFLFFWFFTVQNAIFRLFVIFLRSFLFWHFLFNLLINLLFWK